jgi:biotin synthase-related radical SAM superfamily protein
VEVDLNSVAYKKAVLIAGGPIKVRENFKPPFRLSRSTAGPGAGHPSIVIGFKGTRVKKAISNDEGEFELVGSEASYKLLWKGEPFLEEVEIQPVLYHAPQQAFFNLSQECIYDCKFCNSPRLDKDYTKDLDPEKVIGMILEASTRPDFKGVALTSAVPDDPHKTVMRMAYVISVVREKLGPEIPIGVEPFIDDFQDISRLKAAGADEIKINIETFDQEIFKKVCGKMDFEHIIKAIKFAVSVFGRGKVCSNIIYGLGETDESVIEGVEFLAKIGCVATLRALKIDDRNRPALEETLGILEAVTPERMVKLAREAENAFIIYDMSPLKFKTMCHECTCCDLVPFKDL